MSIATRGKPSFLTIPLEIRDQIYRWINAGATIRIHEDKEAAFYGKISFWDKGSKVPAILRKGWLSILLACRQTHQEAEPLFYKSCQIQIITFYELPLKFFGIISPCATENITSIAIELVVCGAVPPPIDPENANSEAVCSHISKQLPNLRDVELWIGLNSARRHHRKLTDMPWTQKLSTITGLQSLTIIDQSLADEEDEEHIPELLSRLLEFYLYMFRTMVDDVEHVPAFARSRMFKEPFAALDLWISNKPLSSRTSGRPYDNDTELLVPGAIGSNTV